ncbi:MAG: peptidylprolyl isomerase [Pseudobdellovibrionaceae bacterium]
MKQVSFFKVIFSILIFSNYTPVLGQEAIQDSLLHRALNKAEGKIKVETPEQKIQGNLSGFTLVDRIVAIVNSEILLESDFKELSKFLKNEDFIDEALAAGLDTVLLKTDRSVQLEYLIRDKLMLSEAKKLNLEVTEERVDREIEDMSKRAGIGPKEVYEAVGSQGFSKAEYRSFLKSKIEKQNLIEAEIISRLRISDDDAFSEYLKTNPRAKTSIDEFSLAHIFFNPKKGSPQAALDRARGALVRLRQGEKFETLAEQASEDPNFSSGGYLGSFKSGEFLKEIEEAILPLNIGDSTQIVKSRMGYHIVKLLSKKETDDPRFLREKDRIKSRLMSAAFRRQVIIWFQNKRDEAYIKINSK